MGAEAQSVLLRWAVRILSVHKEVQRRVQDEIEEIVGDERDVLWSDREKYVVNSWTLLTENNVVQRILHRKSNASAGALY